jgi:2-polyprenyl-3-methyl-5-hydroxy-6-metoxy-1,4-benzoquinol methylase
MSNEISVHEVTNCPVCLSSGVNLYSNCQDRLFSAPGSWNLSQCSNKLCNTSWVNPAPHLHELKQLYDSYSTHYVPNEPNPGNKFLNKIRTAVLSSKLGYKSSGIELTERIYYAMSFIHPSWRDTQLANVFYIPAKQNGTLLDIGCGNGSSMLTMKALGWKVSGIDFDEIAISHAKLNNLDATVNDLFSAHYEDNSFDAIMLNHVIEHVPNPQKFVEECLRILKPNGTLVALTPNIISIGHRRYKSDWRGLEIPRHLQIFSPTSLLILAERAGFKTFESFTSSQGILQIYDESKDCYINGKFSLTYSSRKNKYLFHLRWFIAGWRHLFFPNLSEVAVLRCKK